MSARERERIAQRKALLVARSELERVQMSLIALRLRDQFAPARGERTAGGRLGSLASVVVAVGLPMLGRHRLARVLRGVSLGLTAWRVMRNWRSPPAR